MILHPATPSQAFPTTYGSAMNFTVRHLVFVAVAIVVCSAPAAGQETAWRAAYAAGENARQAGDHAEYAAQMAAAVAGMPAGHLNRPFAQYQAARASALLGDAAAAGGFLVMAWEEDIEKLMISISEFDTAFDNVREHQAYVEVVARAEDMDLGMSRLADGIYLLEGGGSNVLASFGDDGVLLVDTGYRAAHAALRRALSTVGATTVEFVILTHPHEDHWGMVADLVGEAEIWAHPGTREAMAEPYEFMDDVILEPRLRESRSVLEMTERDFRFNEEVVVFDVSAHTASDLAVYFPESGVLHMGDAYLAGNPMIFPGGDDPDGFLDRLESRLAGMADGTILVGGHDPPTRLEALHTQIRETRACMRLARSSLAEGMTVEETVEAAGDRFPPQWVSYFYRQFVAADVPPLP